MPMRATTVRFSEDLWQLLEDESTLQGISAAQFVRDATIVRLAFLAGRRGDSDSEQSIEAISERAARRHEHARAPSSSVQAPERLDELHRTLLLDSPPEDSFDRLTRLTATVLNVPVALVSLVDHVVSDLHSRARDKHLRVDVHEPAQLLLAAGPGEPAAPPASRWNLAGRLRSDDVDELRRWARSGSRWTLSERLRD